MAKKMYVCNKTIAMFKARLEVSVGRVASSFLIRNLRYICDINVEYYDLINRPGKLTIV